MKKITVYWTEVMHFKGDLEVPDGLDKEEEYSCGGEAEYDWVSNNLPFDVAKDIGSEIEWDSIEIEEVE